jgi:fibronectin-binding autotransporter adhesin
MKVRAFALSLGLSLFASSGWSQDEWTGASDGYWTNAANWLGASVPAADADVRFDVNATGTLATTLGADFTLNSLSLGSPAGPVSVGGNVLTIRGGGIDLTFSSQDLRIDSLVQPDGNQFWSAGSGRSLTLGAALTGAVALTKGGDGRLLLEAGAQLDGLDILGGEVSATNAPVVIFDGGTFSVSNSAIGPVGVPMEVSGSALSGSPRIEFQGATAVVATTSLPVQFPNSSVTNSLWAWYDASAIAATNGQEIATWPDLSGNARDATRNGGPAGYPFYAENAIAGLPAVRFSDDGYASFAFPQCATIRTVFWVLRESVPGEHFLLGDDNNYHFHRGGGPTYPIWSTPYTSANIKSGTTRLMGAVIDGTATPLGAGFRLLSVVTVGNVEASRICMDRNVCCGGRSWAGDIAEILIFTAALTAEQERDVGRYLAVKYSLPTAYGSSYAVPGASVAVSADTRLEISDASLVDVGTISIPAGVTLSAASVNAAQLAGLLQGGGDFRVDGGFIAHGESGAANVYSGNVTVAAGTLYLNGGQNSYPFGLNGSGTRTVTVLSNAVLSVANGTHNPFNVEGNGPIGLVVSNGTVNIPAYCHMSNLTMWAGTVAENGAMADGLDLRTGARLTTRASDNPATISAKYTLRSATLIDVENGAADPDLILSGTATGNGQFLVKTNVGTLFISGAGDNNTTYLRQELGKTILGKASAANVHSVAADGTGLILNAGEVELGGTGGDQIYLNTDVQMSSGALDLNGRSEGFNALAGAGGQVVNDASATVSTLTLGQGNRSGSYGGSIVDGSGQVALVKVGTGTQTLSGTNTFSGGVVVTGGVLQVDGALNGSAVSVAAGALQGSGAVNEDVTVSGGGLLGGGPAGAAGTLTIAGTLVEAPGATNRFDLSPSLTVGGAVNDLIVVGGDLDPQGAALDPLPLPLFASGSYRLFNYSGSLLSAFTLSRTNFGRSTFAIDTATAGQVKLQVTGSAKNLRWNGTVSGLWDLTTTPNWYDLGAAAPGELFYDQDSVLFNDTPGVQTSVQLAGTLQPLSVTVSAATNNFTFAGSGRLSGPMGIAKSGAGRLTVANTGGNDFAGPVVISGGTLAAGVGSALGAVSSGTFVTNGGTLEINGQNLGFERITISGAGVGGTGAVINTGTDQADAIRYLDLAGDAAVGGTARWDVRNGAANLNGATLTKSGPGYMAVVFSAMSNGTMIVSNGYVSMHGTGTRTGPDLTVHVLPGTTSDIANFGGAPDIRHRLVLEGGTFAVPDTSGGITFHGPITVASDSTIFASAGDSLTITNNIGGPGRVNQTSDAAVGRVILTGIASNQGPWTVQNNALLQIGVQNLAQGEYRGSVQLAAAGAYVEFQRAGGYTFPYDISGSGFIQVPCTNGTITFTGTNVAGQLLVGSGSARGTNAATILAGASSHQVAQAWVAQTGFGLGGYGRLEVRDSAALSAVEMLIGNQANGFGDVLQSGGSVSVTAGVGLRIGHYAAGTNESEYALSGGTLNVAGPFSAGWDGRGKFSVSGGTANLAQIQMNASGNSGQDSGIWNLEGGRVNLGSGGILAPGASNAVNWGGGTIGALGTWTGSAAQAIALTGTNGPTTIDTAALAITLAGSLSGSGGLVKAGSGSLIMAGANSYSGTTAVTAGRVAILGNNAGTGAWPLSAGTVLAGTGSVAGVVSVSAGAAVEPGFDARAGALSVGGLTLASNSSANVLSFGSASLLNVTGTNTFATPLAGKALVNVQIPAPVAGLYRVIDYNGAIQGGGFAGLQLGAYPPRAIMSLFHNTSLQAVELFVQDEGSAIEWTGAQNNQWDINTTTNWVTQVSPASTTYLQPSNIGDRVVFNDNAAGNFAVSLAQPVAPLSIVVDSTTNSYAFSGARIEGLSTLTKRGAGTLTLNSSNSFSGATAVEAGTLALASTYALGADPAALATNHLRLGGGAKLDAVVPLILSPTRGVQLTGGAVLLDTRTNLVALGGPVSGAGAIRKEGAGALELRADGSFAGGIDVAAGTAQAGGGGNVGSFGTGPISVSNGAVLAFFRNNDFTIPNNISGGGTWLVRGPGVSGQASYPVNGANAGFAGNIVITNARLNVDNTNDLGAASQITVYSNSAMYCFGGVQTRPLTISGQGWPEPAGLLGALRIENNATWAGSITLADNARIGTRGGTSFLTGNIDGNYELELDWGGAGTPTINVAPSAANTYGTTRVNGPVTVVAGNAAAFSTGALTMAGGTLRLNGFNFGFARLSGAAGQIQNGSATVPSILTVGSDGSNTTYGGTLANGSTGLLNVIKTGAGILELTANSIHSGYTRVAAGTLKFSGAGSVYNNGTLAGTVTVANAATVLVARTDVFGNHIAVPNAQFVIESGGVVENSNTFNTLRNLMLRGGELRANGGAGGEYEAWQLKGTVLVDGTNTSRITATGLINTNTQAQLGDNTPGGVTVFDVADNASGHDLDVTAELRDGHWNTGGFPRVASGLVKTGLGTMRLGATSTYSGLTTVSNGTLLVDGVLAASAVNVDVDGILGGSGSILQPVYSDGIASPGDGGPGLLTVGSYTQTPGATLVIEIAGTVSGSGYDRLAVSGGAAIDGTLSVSTNGYAPQNGDTFTVLTAASVTGVFAATNLPALGAGLQWDVAYNAGSVVLEVVSEAASPYDDWAALYGLTGGGAQGTADPDNDGYQNLLEYSQGSDPTNNLSGAKMSGYMTNGLLRMKFNFSTLASDITYVVESAGSSSNNAPWAGILSNVHGAGWAGSGFYVVYPTASVHRVDAQDVTSGTNRFMRLRVTRP